MKQMQFNFEYNKKQLEFQFVNNIDWNYFIKLIAMYKSKVASSISV